MPPDTSGSVPRADLRQTLQDTLGSGYTLEEELTGGGMSRVFAATDTALGRKVVVKILQPDMAEGVSAERFGREIRFAASLQQANIVPVLITGAMHGLPFYTMPFVEGLSLRERIQKVGALPLTEAVGILRDVARALAYAHERGVVHRDIKPENILLSGDAAVVTDFGIAKAISASRASTGGSAQTTGLTHAGVAMGTPAYMAPEQISGERDIDHRADIYSFGCVAYEIIAGRPPFNGTGRELLASHLADTPAPLTRFRPDCPPVIAECVMRCMAKDPANRPQSTRELLTTLDGLAISGSVAQWTTHRVARAAAVAGLAAVVALGGFVIWRQSGAGGQPVAKSIAVLPLANVGGDSTQEYLADGMTDELSTALGKLGGVRVASRSLARRYRGQRDVDVRDAGRTLNSAYVLQGSLRRMNDKLRVAATLTSVADGVEVWAEIYDRGPSEVFALQDDITRGIAGALKLGRGDAVAQPAAHGTSDPEAYDLFLRGKFLLERRGYGVRQAVDLFQRAIARDSNFARAHASLSLALSLFPYFGDVPARDVRASVTAAANHALSLDSTLAEARVALGLAAAHANEWRDAGVELRRAVELAPREQPPHLQLGRFLLYTNRVEAALAEFETAKALDPYSALPSAWLGETLWILGRRDAAIAEFRRALEIDSVSGPAMQFSGVMMAHIGSVAEARTIAGRLPKSRMRYEGLMGHVLAVTGDRQQALDLARALNARPDAWFTNSSLAYIYLGLRDTARALSALERATERGEIWTSFQPIRDPAFDDVRASPRFIALLKRVGLDTVGFAGAPRSGTR